MVQVFCSVTDENKHVLNEQPCPMLLDNDLVWRVLHGGVCVQIAFLLHNWYLFIQWGMVVLK